VPRARLQELLLANPDRSFTLVSAPAGCGKSTLVSSWLNALDVPKAWLSLDEQDDGLRQFG
jgi:LuxR family maltose regulon positive regulatory protein